MNVESYLQRGIFTTEQSSKSEGKLAKCC